jgi:hypothetical protein
VAIDVDMKDKANLTQPMLQNIDQTFPFASCFLEFSEIENKVIYRHVIPREYELRLVNRFGRAIQGKAVNQVY